VVLVEQRHLSPLVPGRFVFMPAYHKPVSMPGVDVRHVSGVHARLVRVPHASRSLSRRHRHAATCAPAQVSAVGAAAFGGCGRGRAGAATFGRLPDAWEALLAGPAVLAEAAEVVLGRRELLDLTASGLPEERVEQARPAPAVFSD